MATTPTTTTTTTTTAAVIEEVAYDVSAITDSILGKKPTRKATVFIQSKNEIVTKVANITIEYLPNGAKFTESQKNDTVKAMEKTLNAIPFVAKIKDLDGVMTSINVLDDHTEVAIVIDFEVIDHEKFTELVGISPIEYMFGATAKKYKKTIPLEEAQAILEAQKAVKIDMD